jgi:hypothetical protein
MGFLETREASIPITPPITVKANNAFLAQLRSFQMPNPIAA